MPEDKRHMVFFQVGLLKFRLHWALSDGVSDSDANIFR